MHFNEDEQESIYDLSPQFSRGGEWFMCGNCRRRRLYEVQFGSHRGRGGGKWIECLSCMKREQWRRRQIAAAKKIKP